MPPFTYYLLKVIICSGLLYFYYLLALRNKRFHQYNRWYLLSVIGLSFIIPLIKITLWKQPEPQGIMKVITFVNRADAYVVSNTRQLNWSEIVSVAFAIVSFVFLLSVIISLIKIFLLVKSNPKKVWDNICFVFSEANGTPFSFFKYIFWNTKINLESETGKRILKHELVHVNEKHSADKLFLSLVLVVGWVNPFLWLVKREVNMIHEFIADHKAIEDGGEHDFAMMLLHSSYPQQNFMLANSFFHSPIKRRLVMLTSSKKPRYSYVRRLAILPLLSVVVLFSAFQLKDKNTKYSSTAQQTNIAETENNTPGIVNVTTEKEGREQKKESSSTTDPLRERFLPSTFSDTGLKKAYIIIDGKPVSWEDFILRYPSPEGIISINTYTGQAAINKYGEKGKDWVVEIFTKQADEQNNQQVVYEKVFTKVENPPMYSSGGTNFTSFIKSNLQYPAQAIKDRIEGKVLIKFIVDAEGNLTNLEPLTSIGSGLEREAIRLIKSSSPWKPALQNGRNVPFEVKQEIDFVLNGTPGQTQNQEPAQFPGGAEAWRKYLEKHLNANILAENKAPSGIYKVNLLFNVHADGTISNIRAETKPGYGTEEEAIKLIKKGPKWLPAKSNGVPVESEAKQSISFVVSE